MVSVDLIEVVVHSRRWHCWDPRARNARSCYNICVESGGLVGLVGPIDGYAVLRRDLLVQRVSDDAFGETARSVTLSPHKDNCGATNHWSLQPQPHKSEEYLCMGGKRYPAAI